LGRRESFPQRVRCGLADCEPDVKFRAVRHKLSPFKKEPAGLDLVPEKECLKEDEDRAAFAAGLCTLMKEAVG